MKNYNWGIVGQQKISEFLQKSLANNKLAHAYLFSGPEHLGKSLMAEKFMASILCQDYHQAAKLEIKILPCNQCVFCTQLAKGIHPDVYFLKKEEEKKNITVEQVREMHKFLNLTSFLNSYKIALIDKAEDLSEGAQNALLKLLEEPSPKTLLILICQDYKLLLPTIVSRCQVIKFYPVSQDTIFHHLLGLGATREQAHLYTALAQGKIALAINFYKNPEIFRAYLEKVGNFFDLLNSNFAQRFKILESSFSDFKDSVEKSDFLSQELDFWELILRDILFSQQNLEPYLTNLHFKTKITDISHQYSSKKIIELLKQIEQIKHYLAYNINPRLAVENLILNF